MPSPSTSTPHVQPPRDAPASSGERRLPRARPARRACRALASFTNERGVLREVVTQQAAGGTVLVVDRDARSHSDGCLIAHLSAEEPLENASLVLAQYLHEPCGERRRCRSLTDEDLSSLSPAEEEGLGMETTTLRVNEEPVSGPDGSRYALERIAGRLTIPELRWCQMVRGRHGAPRVPLSAREVIAQLESYEPVRALTRQALARHVDDLGLSTAVLRAELIRVQESPIVLNRALREAVLAFVEPGELSMSEIALRCGRVKRDCRGHESGETSWLARRIGLLAEAGADAPTRWIHSDVLGLIARQGLGLDPHEVEL